MQVAVGVVDGLLEQRLGEALDDAAVDLALDDERVDLVAAVVDRDVLQHVDAAGLLVDLDDADVGAERPREVGRVVGDLGLEVRLHAVGQVVGGERLERDRGQRHRLVGRAPHRELRRRRTRGRPRPPRAGGRRCVRALSITWSQAMVDGDAADGERARAVGVHAERADRGVGVEHLDVVGVDAEAVGHDHRPATSRGPGRAASRPVTTWTLLGGQDPHRRRLPAAGRVVERGQHPARAPGRTSRSRRRCRCRGAWCRPRPPRAPARRGRPS